MSTGTTSLYLIFRIDARLPHDLIFGSTLLLIDVDSSPTRNWLFFCQKSFACCLMLSLQFASLCSIHHIIKDYYTLGAVAKIFQPGNYVSVRLKARQYGPVRCLSECSGTHEVLSVKGVVVTFRKVCTIRAYITHHDCLLTHLLSDKTPAVLHLGN